MTSPAPTLAELAALTPEKRDRYVDFLRAVAIIAVVLGHLVVADVVRDAHGFVGHNALATVPLLRTATLLFQVMPLFFVVGGFANAASWTSAQRHSVGMGAWLHGRLTRLARPAVAFVVVWTVAVLALAAGGGSDLASTAGRVVVFPLWFLPVYVAVTSAAPLFWHAHERWAGRAVVALVGAVVTVDLLRFAVHLPFVGLLNVLLVWVTFQQVGFCWFRGGIGSARDGRRLLVGGVLALAVLSTVGPYGLDMVSAPGHGTSNTAPPTLVLLVFGLAQFGLALAVQGPIRTWLRQDRPWAAVIAVNGRAMTLYLWHFSAIVLAAFVLLHSGLAQPEAGSGSWWLLRTVWLLVELPTLLALTMMMGRWERGWPVRSSTLAPVFTAAAFLVAGFVALTTLGFWPGEHLNTVALVAIGVGATLLRTGVGAIEPAATAPGCASGVGSGPTVRTWADGSGPTGPATSDARPTPSSGRAPRASSSLSSSGPRPPAGG